MISFKDTFVMF